MIVIAWGLGDDALNFIKEFSVGELTQALDEAIASAKAYILAVKEMCPQGDIQPFPKKAPMPKNPEEDPIQTFLDNFVRGN